MCGTVARMRHKPGSLERLQRFFDELPAPPGQVARSVYQTDNDPDVYIVAVVCERVGSYRVNAARSQQQAAFARFAEYLVAPPEWQVGAVVSHHRYR